MEIANRGRAAAAPYAVEARPRPLPSTARHRPPARSDAVEASTAAPVQIPIAHGARLERIACANARRFTHMPVCVPRHTDGSRRSRRPTRPSGASGSAESDTVPATKISAFRRARTPRDCAQAWHGALETRAQYTHAGGVSQRRAFAASCAHGGKSTWADHGRTSQPTCVRCSRAPLRAGG